MFIREFLNAIDYILDPDNDNQNEHSVVKNSSLTVLKLSASFHEKMNPQISFKTILYNDDSH